MAGYADHVLRTERGPRNSAEVDRFRRGFFDRKAVQDALGKAVAKGLMSAAANVRKIAQRSMRYRKKASAPGEPPSAHRKGTGDLDTGKVKKGSKKGPLLRELLFFAYDSQEGSVVIGPVRLGRSIVKSLHEFGGKSGRRVYPKRPFMKPALDVAKPDIHKAIKF